MADLEAAKGRNVVTVVQNDMLRLGRGDVVAEFKARVKVWYDEQDKDSLDGASTIKFVGVPGYEALYFLNELHKFKVLSKVIFENCLFGEQSGQSGWSGYGRDITEVTFIGCSMNDANSMVGIRQILNRIIDEFADIERLSYDKKLMRVVSKDTILLTNEMNEMKNNEKANENGIDFRKILNQDDVALIYLFDEIFIANDKRNQLKMVNGIDVTCLLDICRFSSNLFCFPHRGNIQDIYNVKPLKHEIARKDKAYSKNFNSRVWKEKDVIDEINKIRKIYSTNEKIFNLFVKHNYQDSKENESRKESSVTNETNEKNDENKSSQVTKDANVASQSNAPNAPNNQKKERK